MSDAAPEDDTLDDRSRGFQLRAAGIAALAGATVVITVNAMMQNVPRGDYLAVLEHVNERPWFAMRLAAILAMLAWAVAFSTVGKAMTDPRGRAIARMAQPVFTIAVAVFAIDYAHDGFSIGVVAQEWEEGSLATGDAITEGRMLELLVGGTSILFQALIGLAMLLYAVAMLLSGEFSRILCWLGAVGSAGWFLGGAALFMQLPGTSFELFLPFVALATVWVMGTGVALIRRSVRLRTA